MIDRASVERAADLFRAPEGSFARLVDRYERKRRNKRITAGVVGIGVFVAAIAFLLSALSAQPADRTGGELRRGSDVLVSHGDDLLALDPDTHDVRVVAPIKDLGVVLGQLGRAAWSADGNWVAFEIRRLCNVEPCDHPNPAGLWVQGINHPRERLTETCPSSTGPCSEDLWQWSPIGARLAVAEARYAQGTDHARLYLIDPSDGARVMLGGFDQPVTALAWSPDGERLAYAVGGTPPSVYVIDVVGGAEPTLLTSDAGAVSSMTWSPDGTVITLDSGASRVGRLYVIGVDGSGLRLLAETSSRLSSGFGVMWSPDRTRIGYHVIAGPTDSSELEIWTVSPDGSNAIQVHAGCCVTDFGVGPFWSPDGTRLAFQDVAGTWRVTPADGTGGLELIDHFVAISWQGGELGVEPPYSPDAIPYP